MYVTHNIRYSPDSSTKRVKVMYVTHSICYSVGNQSFHSHNTFRLKDNDKLAVLIVFVVIYQNYRSRLLANQIAVYVTKLYYSSTVMFSIVMYM